MCTSKCLRALRDYFQSQGSNKLFKQLYYLQVSTYFTCLFKNNIILQIIAAVSFKKHVNVVSEMSENSVFNYYNVSPPAVDPSLIDEFGVGGEGQDVNAWLDKAENRRIAWLESKKKEKTIAPKKRKLNDASFIKKENASGSCVIKIEIEALDERNKNRNVVVQYVVKNLYEDVLEETENLIRKISKKICDNSDN